MDEKKIQQAFVQFLAQKYQLKSQQELEAKIQELGEQGLKAEYAEFQKVMAQQQSRKMMFGAKLNYIKGLKGQCPQGYEMKYYKQGGSMCAKCEEIKKQSPMNPIDAFKCGRKMKKKACGGSVKKDQKGGTLPTAEPANKRYKGGTYRGPLKFRNALTGRVDSISYTLPQTEYIVGPDQIFNQPAKMTLEYNPALGDSTITEVPPHFVNVSDSWVLPNSVKVQPRTATNRGNNPQEWQTMKKRWEQAKKVTR